MPTIVGMPFTERSEATRTAILTAARKCLASVGYAGMTIRAVAAEAGIDPSMVMRYYGNKEGLFSAAIDIDLQLPDLSGVPRRRLGETLARHFMERWEGEDADEVIPLLLRSALSHPVASARVNEVFAQQVSPAVAKLHGDGQEASERAAMISAHLMGVALCRHLLKMPPIATMDAERLVALIAPALQRYLAG